MSTSTFTKDKPCQSLKIWSDQDLTEEMIDFGVSIYHQYNQDLINGESSASGCGFLFLGFLDMLSPLKAKGNESPA